MSASEIATVESTTSVSRVSASEIATVESITSVLTVSSSETAITESCSGSSLISLPILNLNDNEVYKNFY